MRAAGASARLRERSRAVNVAITGFMGAGKSTAGRRLARLLHIPFIDTDAEIERRFGAIAEIFAREGEAAFRAYEARVIDQVSSEGPRVIAVGGGAVVNPANRDALRRNGVIVNLALKAETAHRRVAHRSHRPLLGPAPSLETIRGIMADRASAYADNDLSIAVDSKTAPAIAHIIARWYRRRAAVARPAQ
ncbi:MAG TPA: shikimate kinase [Candidatus Eremiobacteraceae bacterium]|nr:shikimate kinase [Candidatus Eremiobacteraceae bacterium]